MLHVQCRGCQTSAYVDCSCPEGHDPHVRGHHDACAFGDLDSQVTCPEDSNCCQENHNHGQEANACLAEHDEPCGLDAPGCTVCRPLTITVMPGSIAMHHTLGAGS
jgi:hypothetical protein